MKSLELKIPPLVLFVLIAFLMWLFSILSPFASLIIPWRTELATILFILGTTISFLGFLAFRIVKTTTDPRFPQQTSTLVSQGIYQFSRNPMYLGFVLVLLGLAVYLSDGLCFILLPIFISYLNRFQIIPEERFMLEKFGSKYSNYQKQVRRWV